MSGVDVASPMHDMSTAETFGARRPQQDISIIHEALSDAGDIQDPASSDPTEGLALLGLTGCLYTAGMYIPFVEYAALQEESRTWISALPMSIRAGAEKHCTAKASQYCSAFICYPGATSITEAPIPPAVAAFCMLSGALSVAGLVVLLFRAGLYASESNPTYRVLGKKYTVFTAACSLISGISALIASSFASALLPAVILLFFPFAVHAPLAVSRFLGKGRAEEGGGRGVKEIGGRGFGGRPSSSRPAQNPAQPFGAAYMQVQGRQRSALENTFDTRYAKAMREKQVGGPDDRMLQRRSTNDTRIMLNVGEIDVSSGRSSDEMQSGSSYSKANSPRRGSIWESGDPQMLGNADMHSGNITINLKDMVTHYEGGRGGPRDRDKEGAEVCRESVTSSLPGTADTGSDVVAGSRSRRESVSYSFS